jgi:DNA-binding NarL/FixJ family response regulator
VCDQLTRIFARSQSRSLRASSGPTILQVFALGLDSEGIVQRLNISLRTERNHMSSILKKLEVHLQLQALVFALRHDNVEIP